MAEQRGLPEEIKKMSTREFRQLVRQMSREELDALRRMIYQETFLKKGVRMAGMIDHNTAQYVPVVLDWCVDRGLIKKKSKYALTSYAVKNFIGAVLERIKSEAVERRD